MHALDDHALLRLVAVEASDYKPEALEIACDELRRRNLGVLRPEQYWKLFPPKTLTDDNLRNDSCPQTSDETRRKYGLYPMAFLFLWPVSLFSSLVSILQNELRQSNKETNPQINLNETLQPQQPYEPVSLQPAISLGKRVNEKCLSFEKWSDHIVERSLNSTMRFLKLLLSRKTIVILAVCTFVGAGLFPPWLYTVEFTGTHTRTDAGFAFILKPPSPQQISQQDFILRPTLAERNPALVHGIQLDISKLLIEWACIIAIGGAAWFLSANSMAKQRD